MKDFELLLNERKVILSPSLLEKIKYLVKKHPFLHLPIAKSIEKTELKSTDFFPIYDDICDCVRSNAEYCLKNDENNYGLDEVLFNEVLDLSKKVTEAKFKGDYSNVGELINLMYELIKTEETMWLLRDLKEAKDDCIIDMRYFMDENTINEFNQLYSDAYDKRDIPRLKELLSKVQNLTLEEWKKCVESTTDNMTDEKYCFIGHSTSFTKHFKEFYSRYVSCSLYDQEIHDTYRDGYGFIFAPQNIVGAKSHDLYVRNEADDEYELFTCSCIPIIHHPKRLLEETKKEKQKNIDKKVYSEVVIDGFNPIGIFCFTNGLKEFDYNYCNALELQKNFPNLKIKTFNACSKLTDINKVYLINSIENWYYGASVKTDLNNIFRYDYFLQKFEKMLQTNDYTKSDIERLFKYNQSLLSTLDKEPEELFNGKYNDNEIKYILGKNYNYNFDLILNGRITFYSIQELKRLNSYKDKIENYYPGFMQFLNILSKVDIDEQSLRFINESKPNNFIEFSKVLEKVFENTFKDRENNILSEIQKLTNEYERLYNEKTTREYFKNQYEYFNKISFSSDIWLAKSEYECANISLKYDSDELNRLIEEKNNLEQKIIVLNEQIESEQISDDDEYLKLKNETDELNNQKQILSKHRILNRKRIKQLNNQININNSSLSTILFKRKGKLSISLKVTNIMINSCETNINRLLDRIESDKIILQEIKKKFKEVTGCETIDELEKVKQQADEFMENYDFSNDYILAKLSIDLEQLKNIIDEKKNYLDDMREYACSSRLV